MVLLEHDLRDGQVGTSLVQNVCELVGFVAQASLVFQVVGYGACQKESSPLSGSSRGPGIGLTLYVICPIDMPSAVD